MASVLNELMRKPHPRFWRIEGAKVLFDLIWIPVTGQAQPLGHSSGVRVHGEGGYAKGVTQNYLSRLSTDTGQPQQILQCSRNLAAVIGHKDSAGVFEVLRFGSEQPDGSNTRLEGFYGGLGDGMWRRELLKK